MAPATLLESVKLKSCNSSDTNFRGGGLETPSISQPALLDVRIHRHVNEPIVLRLLTPLSSTLMWAPALAKVGSCSRM